LTEEEYSSVHDLACVRVALDALGRLNAGGADGAAALANLRSLRNRLETKAIAALEAGESS